MCGTYMYMYVYTWLPVKSPLASTSTTTTATCLVVVLYPGSKIVQRYLHLLPVHVPGCTRIYGVTCVHTQLYERTKDTTLILILNTPHQNHQTKHWLLFQ